MQITLNAGNPAETRLIAAFLNDLADLQALQHEKLRSAIDSAAEHTAPVLAAPTQAEATAAITPPKKTRAKKTETAPVEEQASAEPVPEKEPAPVETEAGNGSATTAEPAAESGSSETAEPASVDHDALRVLFGELSQINKREDAVKIVRSYGYNGIKDIAVEKLGEIHGKLLALKG